MSQSKKTDNPDNEELQCTFEEVVALRKLGSVYHDQGKLDDARNLYTQGLKLLRPTLPGLPSANTDVGWDSPSSSNAIAAPKFNPSGLTPAELERWQEQATLLNNMANIYQEEGDYDSAKRMFLAALNVYESVHGRKHHDDIAAVVSNLALIYYYLGDLSSSIDLYKRSLAMHIKVYGAHHPDVGMTLNNLALVYFTDGQLEAAVEAYQNCLKTLDDVHGGAAHEEVASCLFSLASVYLALEDYQKAESTLKRCYRIREKVFGYLHVDTGVVLNNLAMTLMKEEKWYEADRRFTQCLDIFESVLPMGPDDADVATVLISLAKVKRHLGDVNGGLELLQRALLIRETLFGESDVLVADVLWDLGTVFAELHDRKKATIALQRCLQIQEETHGEESLELIPALESYGRLLVQTGELSEAEEVLERLVPLMVQKFGSDSLDVAQTLYLLGRTYFMEKKMGVAETALQRALSIFNDITRSSTSGGRSGQFRKERGEICRSLGEISIFRAKLEAAVEFLEEAVLCLELVPDQKRGLEMARTLRALGKTHQKLKNYHKAEISYKRALPLYMELRGSDDLETAAVIRQLALVKRQGGSPGRSVIRLLQKTVDRLVHEYGETHSEVVSSAETLGIMLLDIDQLDQALKNFKLCLKISCILFGPEHADNQGFRFQIADIHLRMGAWGEAEAMYGEILRMEDQIPPTRVRRHSMMRILREGEGNVSAEDTLAQKSRQRLERMKNWSLELKYNLAPWKFPSSTDTSSSYHEELSEHLRGLATVLQAVEDTCIQENDSCLRFVDSTAHGPPTHPSSVNRMSTLLPLSHFLGFGVEGTEDAGVRSGASTQNGGRPHGSSNEGASHSFSRPCHGDAERKGMFANALRSFSCPTLDEEVVDTVPHPLPSPPPPPPPPLPSPIPLGVRTSNSSGAAGPPVEDAPPPPLSIYSSNRKPLHQPVAGEFSEGSSHSLSPKSPVSPLPVPERPPLLLDLSKNGLGDTLPLVPDPPTSDSRLRAGSLVRSAEEMLEIDLPPAPPAPPAAPSSSSSSSSSSFRAPILSTTTGPPPPRTPSSPSRSSRVKVRTPDSAPIEATSSSSPCLSGSRRSKMRKFSLDVVDFRRHSGTFASEVVVSPRSPAAAKAAMYALSQTITTKVPVRKRGSSFPQAKKSKFRPEIRKVKLQPGVVLKAPTPVSSSAPRSPSSAVGNLVRSNFSLPKQNQELGSMVSNVLEAYEVIVEEVLCPYWSWQLQLLTSSSLVLSVDWDSLLQCKDLVLAVHHLYTGRSSLVFLRLHGVCSLLANPATSWQRNSRKIMQFFGESVKEVVLAHSPHPSAGEMLEVTKIEIEPVSSARFYMNWDSGKLYLLYALDQEGDSGIFDEETLCAVVEFIGSVGFHSSFVDESSREAEEEAEPLSSSADEAKWVCLEAASMLWRKLGTSKYFLAVLRPLINPEMQESDFFYSFSQFIPPNFPGVMSPLTLWEEEVVGQCQYALQSVAWDEDAFTECSLKGSKPKGLEGLMSKEEVMIWGWPWMLRITEDKVQVRRVALLTDRALYLAQYDVKNKKPVENKTWRRYDLSTLQCIDVGPSEGSSKFNDVYLALYFQDEVEMLSDSLSVQSDHSSDSVQAAFSAAPPTSHRPRGRSMRFLKEMAHPDVSTFPTKLLLVPEVRQHVEKLNPDCPAYAADARKMILLEIAWCCYCMSTVSREMDLRQGPAKPIPPPFVGQSIRLPSGTLRSFVQGVFRKGKG